MLIKMSHNLQIIHIWLIILPKLVITASTTSPDLIFSSTLPQQTTQNLQNLSQTTSSSDSSSTYVSSIFSYFYKKSNASETQPTAEKLTDYSTRDLSGLTETSTDPLTTSLFEKIQETFLMVKETTFDSSSTTDNTKSQFTTSDENFMSNLSTLDDYKIESDCECLERCYMSMYNEGSTVSEGLTTTEENEESTNVFSSDLDSSTSFYTSTTEFETEQEAEKPTKYSLTDDLIKVTKELHEYKVRLSLMAHELSKEKSKRKEAENELKNIKNKSEELKNCQEKLTNQTSDLNYLAKLIDIERYKSGLSQRIDEFELSEDLQNSNKTFMKFLIFELETENAQVTLVSNQNLITIPSRLVELAPKLSEFSASNCGLEFIHSSSFENLENLKVLNLSRNLIKKNENKTFEDLKSLEILDLSSNLIEKLEIFSFYGLNNLIELNLSNNKIQSLPHGIFEHQTQLRILNLSNNFISELKIEIFPLIIKINEFYVNNNLLQFIDPKIIEAIESAIIVDFTNNFCIDMKVPESGNLLKLGIYVGVSCSSRVENDDEFLVE